MIKKFDLKRFKRKMSQFLPAIDEDLSIVLNGVSEDSERSSLELLLLLLLSLLWGQVLLVACHCVLVVFCKSKDMDFWNLAVVNN